MRNSKANVGQRSLSKAIAVVLSGVAFNASAESYTGISDVNYGTYFGAYYYNQNGYAGAAYQYSLGMSRSIADTPTSTAYGDILEVTATATDGFGEAGDYWTVNGADHAFEDIENPGYIYKGVGQLSWCQAGTCAGGTGTSSGHSHSAQHAVFSVTTEADIKITLSSAAGIEGFGGPWHPGSDALANDLIPGFTLYSGISQSGWNPITHSFNNMSDFTLHPLTQMDKYGTTTTFVPTNADLTYLAHDANIGNVHSITQTFHLTEGFYSLFFGTNFANIPNNNSTLPCETLIEGTSDCTGYGGFGKNFQLTIETATAPVPVPAAAWLFGGAIASLVGAVGRRKKT